MSALIRVILSSESAQLQPGEWADITATVQNMSETVGRYRLTVEGVPPTWVEISRQELSLFPKDKDTVRLTLRPPESADTRAGRYDVQVQVTTLEEPIERTTAAFVLEVRGKAALELTLDPPLVRAPKAGTVKVRVNNRGNTDLTVLLEAEDPSGGCFFTFATPQVVVPAGQERTAQVVVQATAPLSGRAPRTHQFTVAARPAEAPRLAQQAQGQWEQLPTGPAWWLFLLGGLVLLGAIAALFYFFVWPRLQVQPTPVAAGPTATAKATAVQPTAVQPTVGPTQQATVATAMPTPEPTPEPTPDLKAELEARLNEYNIIRAKAEMTLDPSLLKSICVDPYLSEKTASINKNKADGVHWETPKVTFVITSLDIVAPDEVKVGVRKTETKLFFPKGSSLPDDEICSGPINSWRDCTYDILYIMRLVDGKWYVSSFTVSGNCVGKCQH